MEKPSRIGKILRTLAAAAVLLGLPLSAAAEGPYKNYTYDAYDNAVPTAAGYLPDRLVSGDDLGIGPFNGPTDLYFDNQAYLYLLDAGNSRIVVMNRDLTLSRVIRPADESGAAITFQNAQGLFVRDGTLYVADMDAKQVYILDSEGRQTGAIGAPVSAVLPAGFDYKPSKVLVDSTGMVYVISYGCYSGALQFNAAGEFLGFYGSESVTMTADLVMAKIWAKIVPKSMSSSQIRAVPVNYNNFDLGEDDLIYTTKDDVESTNGQVRKLNYYGKNLLFYNGTGQVRTYGDLDTYTTNQGYMASILSDVDVDENGFISVLDTRHNRIFQYDRDSNLLFIFGGSTGQLGCFTAPCALESYDDQVLVLDRQTGSITVMKATYLAKTIRAGSLLLSGGHYAEGKPLWEEVLRYDGNYTLANVGLGKAYEAQRDYQASLEYFYTANDREGYSNAFYQYRSEVLRQWFPAILIGVVALFALSAALGYVRRRRKAVSDYDIRVTALRYPFYTMRHPFKGYTALKEEKKGSKYIAHGILLLFFAVSIFVRQNTSFLFTESRPEDFNIGYTFVSTVGIFAIAVLSNWALSTLMNGEGRFMEIWTFGAYALLPYVIAMVPLTILSNVLVTDEGAFFRIAVGVVYAWVFIGVVMAVREVHQFTMKQTVLSLLGTLLGVVIIGALYAIIYSMFTQLVSFAGTAVSELLLRL